MGGGTIAFNKLVILNLFQDLFFFIASFKYRFPIKTFGNDNLFTPILHHMLDKSESMVTITQAAKGSGRPTSRLLEAVPPLGGRKLRNLKLLLTIQHQGDGAPVNEMYVHHGAEPACLDLHSALPDFPDEELI